MSIEKMEQEALARHLALVYSERLVKKYQIERDCLSEPEEEDLSDAIRYLQLRRVAERAKREGGGDE